MIDLQEQIRERYEKRLRKILKINRHLVYNKDASLGPIGAWILTSKKGIDSGIKLLIEKAIGIYIHQEYGSAVFLWDYYEQEFTTQVWFNKKLQTEKRTKNVNELKELMCSAWEYCRKKKKDS
jgi:hypothetical protein